MKYFFLWFLSLIKLVFVDVGFFLLIYFFYVMTSLSDHTFITEFFLSQDYSRSTTAQIESEVISSGLFNCLLYDFSLTLLAGLVWLFIVILKPVQGPAKTLELRILWVLIMWVGLLLNWSIFYYMFFNVMDTLQLSVAGILWVVFFVFYVLSFLVSTAFSTPHTARPAVPFGTMTY